MMNEIKIALSVQNTANDGYEFTYPEDFSAMSVQQNDWTKSILDSRDARQFTADKIYAIWRNELGNYYAVIVANKNDYRGGKAMLVLFIGKQVPSDGFAILSCLNALEDMIIKNGVRDKDKVGNYLTSFEKKLRHEFIPYGRVDKLSFQKVYRTFSDEKELAEIFQHIEQEEYSKYKRVLIVPKGSLKLDVSSSNFEEIKSVIRHFYKVTTKNPALTRVSSSTVADGDDLTITYLKHGFDNYEHHVRISKSDSPFYRIEGEQLIVSDPNELNIPFKKTITLNILSSSDGRPIPSGYVNNEEFGNGKYQCCLEDPTKKFEIRAAGYQTITIEEIGTKTNSGILTIKLTPKAETLTRIIKIDNESKSVSLTLTSDHPLYPVFKEKHNYDVIISKKDFDRDKNRNGESNGKWKEWIMSAVVFLAALTILGLLGYFVKEEFFPDEPTRKERQEPVNDQGRDNNPTTYDAPGTKEEQTGEKLDSLLAADISYLKTQDVWHLDTIRTDKYRTLITFMQDGNTEDLINHSYNKANQINGYWTQIVGLMKKILTLDESYQNQMVEIIMQESSDGICNLSTLVNELSGIMPQKAKKQATGGSNQTRQGHDNQVDSSSRRARSHS